MRSTMHSQYVSIALSKLRKGVAACCWILALSLLAQTLAWGIATFLDVRYEEVVTQTEPPPLIVANNAKSNAANSSLPWDVDKPVDANAALPVVPDRVLSRHEKTLETFSSIAFATGTISMIVLLPLLFLGVLLGASSATPGVERTVSAFMWAMVLSMLVFPIGAMLGLPWEHGAVCTYSYMTSQVDLVLSNATERMVSLEFYTRFAVLPLACVVGASMVGLRFASGVEAGIIPKENLRLDPVLEKEAANIKATSLHGGRAAAALRTVAPAAAPAPAPAASVPLAAAAPPPAPTNTIGAKPSPGIGQVTAGEPLKRLI